MSHSLRRTLAGTVNATARANATSTAISLDRNKGFDVDQVDLQIESGANTSVTGKVLVGARQIAPETGEIKGGGQLFEMPTDEKLDPGTDIDVRWTNGTGEAREIIVLVKGTEDR